MGPNLPVQPLVLPNIQALNVGQASPHLPATRAEMLDLSGADLNRLAVQYNDDFGVQPNDTEATQRDKFVRWVERGDL